MSSSVLNPPDRDPNRRIKQMIAFINLEAKEKAEEILSKSEEEFQIEKGRILNPEKLRIKQEYDRKFKELEIQKKIKYSTLVNNARLKVLKQREILMNKLKENLNISLQNVKKNKNNYNNLIKNLIIQVKLQTKKNKKQKNKK